MKILHTSDIHIYREGDDRWKALEEVVWLCNEENIDVLVIAGDMFDSNIDGIKLVPNVRKLFDKISSFVIILPGNHDYSVFQKGHYWGDKVKVIKSYKDYYEVGKAVFWGLPFENIEGEDVLYRLYEMNDKMEVDKVNILIFHGELLDGYAWASDFGEESNKRYMPVKSLYFKDMKIKYVLAGHFHTRFSITELPSKGFFVYSGSPVSITKKEIGKRKVNIFRLGESPIEKELSSFHYEEINIYLDPFTKKDVKKIIDEELLYTKNLNCKIILNIRGYICDDNGVSEADISKYIDLKEKEEGYSFFSKNNEVRNLSDLFSSQMFSNFYNKLNKMNITESEKKEIMNYVIIAMMESI